MGFYNSILMMSFALGPLTLSLSGTKGFLPFLICIALLSLAGLPLLLTGSYVPSTIDKPRFGVFSFAFVAPLLAMACFVVAFQDLSITSLMPVYGLRIGMTESNATLMLFFGISGGALLQFPIGWAADHFDPRKVLIACAFAGLIGAAIWPFTAYSPYLLWATLFLWWGLFSGVTTVAMILAGNWFRGSELATAMAAFGVFWGMGAFVGPLTSGAIMDLWNPYGLPLTLIIVAGIFFLITLFPRFYRLPQSREFS
jgi:MFS family permease